MRIDKSYMLKYFPDGPSPGLVADSGLVPAAVAIFKAVEIRRDELRATVEKHPKHNPQDLEDDVDFMLGGIRELNWVLGLPERSREFIQNIK
uniref:Uncharacterized protein n=1 Tax=viral metagenome TaxID=1070528 RepID=A0A6M3ILJ5_9ZZZZ